MNYKLRVEALKKFSLKRLGYEEFQVNLGEKFDGKDDSLGNVH